MRLSIALLVAVLVFPTLVQAQKPRERDLKLPIGGTPGALDAITDVAGIEVGHATLISGSGKLVVGTGPVRTGVTVIHPRGKANSDPVFAAWFTLNGNGEMTGTTWVQESGLLEGPVAITNTHSVGVVRDAIIQQRSHRRTRCSEAARGRRDADGGLNDINEPRAVHVLALVPALARRAEGGAVGGGTWMVCHGLRAASAPPRNSRRNRAATRLACWCSAITDRAATCALPACQSAMRFRIWRGASPMTIRCLRAPAVRAAARRPAAARLSRRRNRDRSSSSWRRTRRFCRIS